ncbi:MAG: penicillin-binding protein activator [Candidatus Woesearchaeota archaeon]|nr:penicillin-binding protein activator [Candidatus Woesearchaeota archaeon]
MKLRHIAIALLMLNACTITGNVVHDEKINICTILPHSGEWAIFGMEMQRGVELAIQEVNEKGGVNGKLVRAITEDDGYERRRTVNAAHKLIHTDRCDSLITPFIETTWPIIDVVEQAHIPTLVMLDRIDAVNDYDYIFSNGFSTEQTGKHAASYAYAQGTRTAVVVMDQIEWSIIIGNVFADRFEKLGGVARRVTLPPDDDLQGLSTLLKEVNPDVVHFSFTLNDADLLLKKAKEQGVEALFLGGDAFTADVIAAAGDLAEGVCKTDVPLRDSEEEQTLERAYREKNGEDPLALSMVMLGYDAARVMLAGYERMAPGETLQQALVSIADYPSIFGDVTDLSDGGGAWRVEKIHCVRDGEAVLVEEFP